VKLIFTLSLLALLWGCGSSGPPPASLVAEYATPAHGEDGTLLESIGIETLGGVFMPILEKGCSVPCANVQVFSTAADQQDQITISLYRGNSKVAAECSSLGEYRIEGVPLQPGGVPAVEVRFAVEGGNVILTATCKSAGQAFRIVAVED
jgi:molecular chaperone DnaK (HSP70)